MQFEDGILDTCLMLLDVNPKFLKDRSRDCSRRSSPIYVGRVVSGMVSTGCRERETDRPLPSGMMRSLCPALGMMRTWGRSRPQQKQFRKLYINEIHSAFRSANIDQRPLILGARVELSPKTHKDLF